MSAKVIPISAARVKRYDAKEEKENNVIGNRIRDARKRSGLTLTDLSERLSDFGMRVSRAAAGKWETGETVPNAYQLIALFNALGIEDRLSYFMEDYDPVLNDTGLRKIDEYRADLIASGNYRPVPKTATAVDFIEMKISDMFVSAGNGAFLDEGGFETIRFPKDKVPDGADFGVRVTGDSMEPVYHDGQIVWVQECERIKTGEVGVFICDGEGFLKAYGEKEPDESIIDEYTDSYGNVHPQSMLISYNEAYETKVIPPESNLKIVGRVL